MLTRRTVIVAGRETTYGTDPALTPSNCLYAYDVDVDIKGDVLERDVLRDTLSRIGHVIGMKECTLTFKTELKNVGVLSGTVEPEVGMVLSGCGFNTGVMTGTSRKYSLVSDEASMNSVSFRVYKDGNVHKILGSRGTFKAGLTAGKYGEMSWEFQGLFDPVAAATVVDHTGAPTGVPPIVYNSGFQIAGFSPVCSTAEIDMGNEVTKRASLNSTYGIAGFRLTSRKPMINFKADAVVESSNPFWGDWNGAVVDTWAIQVGSNGGNIIRMNGYFAYESNKYTDEDGISTYDCKAALVSSDVNSSNDELSITFV